MKNTQWEEVPLDGKTKTAKNSVLVYLSTLFKLAEAADYQKNFALCLAGTL
jgi:hypothetical protein